MPNLGSRFYKKLVQISAETGMKPEDIIQVMIIESGLDPAAHNKSGASGLTQFMPETLQGLGFQGSQEEFRLLAGENQLDYVKKWIHSLSQFGPLKSAAQYYVGNFLPVALTLPGVKAEKRNTIIVAKNPKKPHLPGVSIKKEQSFYNSNVYLDFNKDGFITYGDIQDRINQASKSKNYQLAISNLRQSTGYSPKSQIAKKPTNLFKMDNLLDSYLQNIAASERFDKKLYKSFLPSNNFLIKIQSDSLENSAEFARILSSALETELLARAFIHSNGEEIEVECQIHGSSQDCLKTTQQLTEVLSETFRESTQKIGGIRVSSSIIMDKKSFYQPINIKLAESLYRRFIYKFL